MTKRIPCPDCGETKTLEMMRYEIARLKKMKEEKERAKTPYGAHSHTIPGAYGYHTHSIPAYSFGYSNVSTSADMVSSSTTPYLKLTTDSSSTVAGGDITWTDTSGWHGLSLGTDTLGIRIGTDEKPMPEKPASWRDYRIEIDGRANGVECCIGCGRLYHPHVHDEAEALTDEIDRLRAEVLHPLEVLALEAED